MTAVRVKVSKSKFGKCILTFKRGIGSDTNVYVTCDKDPDTTIRVWYYPPTKRWACEIQRPTGYTSYGTQMLDGTYGWSTNKADDDDLKVHFTVGNKDCVINASSYGIYLAGRRVKDGYFQLMGYAVETEEQKNERKESENSERTKAQKQKANRVNGQTPRWPAADQVPSQG